MIRNDARIPEKTSRIKAFYSSISIGVTLFAAILLLSHIVFNVLSVTVRANTVVTVNLIAGAVCATIGVVTFVSIVLLKSFRKINLGAVVIALFGFSSAAAMFMAGGDLLPAAFDGFKVTVLFIMLAVSCVMFALTEFFLLNNAYRTYIGVGLIFALAYPFMPNSTLRTGLLIIYLLWLVAGLVYTVMLVLALRQMEHSAWSVFSTAILTLLSVTAYMLSSALEIPVINSWCVFLSFTITLSALFFAYIEQIVWENPARSVGTTYISNDANADDRHSRILSLLYMRKACSPKNHMQNVAEYVRIMCSTPGISSERLDMIEEAAYLHDIGKLAIPSSILDKQELLTPVEYDQIRAHVLHGYNILSGFNDEMLDLAATIAQQHHERCDGSGYLGFIGRDINPLAAITAVADTFDALTSFRPYKRKWEFDEAFDYICQHNGDFYTAEAVDRFIECKEDIRAAYAANEVI